MQMSHKRSKPTVEELKESKKNAHRRDEKPLMEMTLKRLLLFSVRVDITTKKLAVHPPN
jgi:hypothetical protein